MRKKRQDMLLAHYQSGQTRIHNMLRADFGDHWPPNGLDIRQPIDDADVRFKTMTRYILENPFRAIPFFVPSVTTLIVMAYSRTIGLAMMIAGGIMDFVSTAGFIKRKEKTNTIHFNPITAAFLGRVSAANVLSHEHWHLVQKLDGQSSLSSSLDDDKGRFGVKALLGDKKSRSHIKYLSMEYELQARIYTTVMNAYQQHNVMPVTKAELWAALYSQGIEVPESYLTGDEAIAAQKKFPKDMKFIESGSDKSAASDINKLANAIVPASSDKFWDYVIPGLYGDIIELIGDRYGSARMGFPCNIQLHEVFLKHARDHERALPGTKTAHLLKMQTTLHAMPIRQAFNLCSRLSSQNGAIKTFHNIDVTLKPQTVLTATDMLKRHPEIGHFNLRLM